MAWADADLGILFRLFGSFKNDRRGPLEHGGEATD
jgi:hypothetical protein